VLIRRDTLECISAGEVDLAFRRWTRPTVKSGGALRTQLGMLRIESVEMVDAAAITDSDARRAGAAGAEELRRDLAERDGAIYRVQFGPFVADPRTSLREEAPGAQDVELLRTKLAKMDARSERGAWTSATLRLIGERPAVRAGDLADVLGVERLVFKRDVRKLKELGLTVSLEVGYRLSPRGEAFLRATATH
jgi:hypothetical protein